MPALARHGTLRSLHGYVARWFEHPRVREAFSFHSLFIGGDPYRVPAIYAALVYLQVADGGWYAEGGTYAVVEAMAAPLDVRCGVPVERIEHAGGRVTGVALAGGERIAADVVVSNADVLRTRELLGLPAAAPAAARDDVVLPALPRDRPARSSSCSTTRCWSATATASSSARSRAGASCRAPSRPTCTRRRAPSRRWPRTGGDSLAVLLPVPNLRAGIDWDRDGDRLRDALLDDLEASFGLAGLRDAIVVEHRMTPVDFARDLGAVWGNAFAVEPTLHQSACFRQPNRDRRLAGLYFAGGGTHPGAGVPGRAAGRRDHRGPDRAPIAGSTARAAPVPAGAGR